MKQSNNIEILQKVYSTKLEKGDTVFIHPIPDVDKHCYTTVYVDEVEEFVNAVATVTDVDTTDNIVELDNKFWLLPYHLEKLTTSRD